MMKIINKLFGEKVMLEQWPARDSLDFDSVHGDETCQECGVECSDEYCKHCAPHMERA